MYLQVNGGNEIILHSKFCGSITHKSYWNYEWPPPLDRLIAGVATPTRGGWRPRAPIYPSLKAYGTTGPTIGARLF